MSEALPINWNLLIFVLSSYKIITHRYNEGNFLDFVNDILYIISFIALIVTGHRIPRQLTDIGHLFIFVLSSYNYMRYRSIVNEYLLRYPSLRTRRGRHAEQNLYFSFIALVVTGLHLIGIPLLPDIASGDSSLVLAVRSLVSRGSSLPLPDIPGIDFIAALLRITLGCFLLSKGILHCMTPWGIICDTEVIIVCVLGVTCFHSWQLFQLLCTTMRLTYGSWFQGDAFEISLDIIFILNTFLVLTGANLASLTLPNIPG